MVQTQLALSWASYRNDICAGIGTLQQNGDFVDMTLAADGHFVKVHQMVLSLVSPYFKELIKSAPCQHPVIFLNKVSYKTLCSLLEYIYTGEVVVAKENFDELVDAGKALHIKGLVNMSVYAKVNLLHCPEPVSSSQQNEKRQCSSLSQSNIRLTSEPATEDNIQDTVKKDDLQVSNTFSADECNYSDNNIMADDMGDPIDANSEYIVPHVRDQTFATNKGNFEDDESITKENQGMKSAQKSIGPTIQFTVSNQGNIQLVLNRYIYFLRYSGRNKPSGPGRRLWRCVDYIKKRCPASAVTKDNMVVQRAGVHIHPFHDKRIAKKVRDGSIFAAITEAEQQGDIIKNKKDST